MKRCMWAIAVLWFLVENQFFGWHATPQSANELLADGIGYILISLAVISGMLKVTVYVHNHAAEGTKVVSEVKAGRKSVPIK